MNTKVNLAGIELKNPVMTASGTFGSGEEYGEMIDLNCLGAVVTKGVASVPWPGNPTPRIAETYGGMINAIGLQNPGMEVFVKRDVPFLKKYDTKERQPRIILKWWNGWQMSRWTCWRSIFPVPM